MRRATNKDSELTSEGFGGSATIRIRKDAIYCFVSLLLWNPLSVATTTTTTTTSKASTLTHITPPKITGKELSIDSPAVARAHYVRDILSRRLHYVQVGNRMDDFSKWVKANGGETKVFSMHGVDYNIDFSHHNETIQKEEQKALSKRSRNTRDPFSPDRMNLELVQTPYSPPSCFDGKRQHLIDNGPPNALQLCCRAVKLGIHFAPVLSTVGLAVVSKTFRQKVWYSWVASCIGSCGAAWIKWGQWSSTRNDMFPEALCDQLATLHNDAPAHSWAFSERTMESSLGLMPGTLSLVFDDFDKQPIASGSIAQVHKAVLNGELVAVKIRHPRVAQLIDMDFRLMTAAARVFDWIPGLAWLHIRDSVEQFSHTMAAQSYLHVEAHHLEVLNYNFRGWPHVRFPQPFYASSAVIIESFEPGRIVTGVVDKYDAIASTVNNQGSPSGQVIVQEVRLEENEGGKNKENEGKNKDNNPAELIYGYELIPTSLAQFLVTTGLGVYLKMLLVDNLMHADLHPGNLLVIRKDDDVIEAERHRGLRNPSTTTENKPLAMIPHSPPLSREQLKDLFGITLVDAGMVAQLTEEESSTFIGLMASLGDGNGKEAAEFALQFSLENTMDTENHDSFVQDMVDLFAERCRGYGTGVDVGHVLRGILTLIRKHHVRIDANFATLVVNALCVESLARSVCPNYNVLDAARPLLSSYKKMCYKRDGTPKPRARKSKLVKLWLSLMYVKKEIADNAFFSREAKRNQKRLLHHH